MNESGTRKVRQLAANTFILTDVSHSERGTVSKTRLVKLYPSQMAWTSTTVAGVQKYSQFSYKITPDGKFRSHLNFTGLQLDPKRLPEKEILILKRKTRDRVSSGWKHLARALEEELG